MSDQLTTTEVSQLTGIPRLFITEHARHKILKARKGKGIYKGRWVITPDELQKYTSNYYIARFMQSFQEQETPEYNTFRMFAALTNVPFIASWFSTVQKARGYECCYVCGDTSNEVTIYRTFINNSYAGNVCKSCMTRLRKAGYMFHGISRLERNSQDV